MNRRKSRRTLSVVGAALCVALLGGCERADERVISPVAENNSRNDAASRVAQAGAPPPPTEITASSPASPAREALSDAVITARIKTAMLTDPALEGSDVSVTTSHGAVVLNGTVKTYEQTGMASAYAQRQEGVMRVDNQLSLPPQ